jgi:hypothetical protein
VIYTVKCEAVTSHQNADSKGGWWRRFHSTDITLIGEDSMAMQLELFFHPGYTAVDDVVDITNQLPKILLQSIQVSRDYNYYILVSELRVMSHIEQGK